MLSVLPMENTYHRVLTLISLLPSRTQRPKVRVLTVLDLLSVVFRDETGEEDLIYTSTDV
jgi:hypothetical protein